jgi:hypothetical protein
MRLAKINREMERETPGALDVLMQGFSAHGDRSKYDVRHGLRVSA